MTMMMMMMMTMSHDPEHHRTGTKLMQVQPRLAERCVYLAKPVPSPESTYAKPDRRSCCYHDKGSGLWRRRH